MVALARGRMLSALLDLVLEPTDTEHGQKRSAAHRWTHTLITQRRLKWPFMQCSSVRSARLLLVMCIEVVDTSVGRLRMGEVADRVG